jgi:hypothetical protein
MQMPTPTLHSHDRPNARGFALPAAIFALVVVAFLVTAGIHLANQESRIGHSTERAGAAFYVAETGLHTALADWSPGVIDPPIWGAEVEMEGDTDQGRWEVRILRVDSLVYKVRSVGSVATRGGEARRDLALMARLTTLEYFPSGALTIRGGLTASGAPKKIEGADEHPPGWSGVCAGLQDDLPGIVTDDADAVEASPWNPPGAECPQQFSGDPCIQEDADRVEQDWDKVNEQWDEFTALATHVISSVPTGDPTPYTATDEDGNVYCDVAHLYNWGHPTDLSHVCANHFPLVHATGDIWLEDGAMGQGILMVDGDFYMQGNARFHGIVLVRGTFHAVSGTPTILGAVMAESVGQFGGTPNLFYSSCAVDRALKLNSGTRVRPLAERAWVDITGTAF